MRRSKLLLVSTILIITAISVTGCTRAFRNILGIQSDAKGTPVLETFKPKHSGFEVMMPGPRDQVASGNIMSQYFVYKHEDGAYSLSYGLPYGVLMGKDQFQQSLDEHCEKLVKEIPGTTTVSKPIEYFGSGLDPDAFRGGKEIEGTLDSGDGKVFKMRVYLVGTTTFKSLYQLLVVGKKEFVNSSEANRYLSSLKLLDR